MGRPTGRTQAMLRRVLAACVKSDTDGPVFVIAHNRQYGIDLLKRLARMADAAGITAKRVGHDSMAINGKTCRAVIQEDMEHKTRGIHDYHKFTDHYVWHPDNWRR